jgi:putative FmdB family regulatory protein
MPTYEYRCNACGRKVTLKYKTYAEYDEATPACTHCDSTDLTRLISRVAIQTSMTSRLMSGDWEDDAAFDDLDNADPRLMGRVLREMSAETGEDLGGEFEEVVTRLERGENPDEIEKTLPPLVDDDSPAGDVTSTTLGDD